MSLSDQFLRFEALSKSYQEGERRRGPVALEDAHAVFTRGE